MFLPGDIRADCARDKGIGRNSPSPGVKAANPLDTGRVQVVDLPYLLFVRVIHMDNVWIGGQTLEYF